MLRTEYLVFNLKKLLIPLFSFVWRKKLDGREVLSVTGWRSGLFKTKSGQRIRGTLIIRR